MAKNGKRGGQPEESASGDAWLTSYADVMSLLLVLFIVMFAMANTDLKNFVAVADALRAAFNGVGPSPAGSLIGDTNSTTSSTSVSAAPLFYDNLPPKQRDFVRISTELTTLAQQAGIGGDIDIKMSMEGIIISLSDALIFEPGSATLKKEAQEVLLSVAETLEITDNNIRVEGNTDDIPTNSPEFPSNWELSVARAVTIVRFLTEEAGIESDRLSALGNAEFNPLVPNDSRDNRKINRRADIVVVYPSGSRRFSVTVPGIEGNNVISDTLESQESQPVN